jgi:hypothetical protein
MNNATATFAARLGYSDVHPYEVIRHVTDKTIEIREMDAKIDFQPTIVPGGFAGHCTNNTEGEQKWIITSNENNRIIRIRLHKNGQWKDANGNRYQLGDKPRKFYDYNF